MGYDVGLNIYVELSEMKLRCRGDFKNELWEIECCFSMCIKFQLRKMKKFQSSAVFIVAFVVNSTVHCSYSCNTEYLKFVKRVDFMVFLTQFKKNNQFCYPSIL